MEEEIHSNDHITVEQIIFSSYVRYEKLQSLVYNTFSNTSIASATELNVFIDLYSVLKQVFSTSGRTIITNYTDLTSGLINMCSHYRYFFRGLGVHTKFYLIFSFNTCEINRKFVNDYNKDFLEKSEIPLFREMTMSNLELLDLICPYLPDIFFIKSINNYETSIMISHLINRLNDGQPNLIISKDIYPLQLCCIHPYTSYLYPIKYHGEDLSLMLPISEKPSFRQEFWNLLTNRRKFSESSMEKIMNISPINFPLLSAINRFPERNITSLGNIGTAIDIIYKLVGSNDIKIYPQQLYEDHVIMSKIPVTNVEARLNALDISYIYPYYDNDPESKSIKLENLPDNGQLQTINAKFFANNPIDLNRL